MIDIPYLNDLCLSINKKANDCICDEHAIRHNLMGIKRGSMERADRMSELIREQRFYQTLSNTIRNQVAIHNRAERQIEEKKSLEKLAKLLPPKKYESEFAP